MRRASPAWWPFLGALILGAGACAHAPAGVGLAAGPGVASARAAGGPAGGRAFAPDGPGASAPAARRARAPAAASLPAPPVRVTPLSADEVSALLRQEHAPPPRPGHGAEGDRPARLTVDADLARLTRVLGSLRAARGRGRHRAPRVVASEWSRMLGRLDAYLDQPPSETPPSELVRTRIVVETELAHDARAWHLPPDLVARIRSRLAYLDHRLRRDRLPAIPAVAPRHIEWPIDPVVVNSPFGLRTDPIDGKIRFHDGLDLDGRIGQAVTAAADGVVVWAGWRGGYGRHIELAHGGGWVTTYSHLSRILVHRGDKVQLGDLIGLVGSTGRSTGPHLHFEVLHHGHVLDPTSVLGDPIYADQNPGTGLGGE